MQARTMMAVVAAMLLLSAGAALANIYQWEWVNPSDPSQGRQQSATLCAGGAGVNAAPSVNLSLRDLSKAYLINANLPSAWFSQSTLTNADMSGANLTNVWFPSATLTGANFIGADLTDASFGFSTLTGADLTNANVQGASFRSATGFAAAQLYSTANYKAKDLTGIGLDSDDLTGWNLSGQNLTDAYMASATLTGANMSGSNLTDASFSSAVLTDADLSGADLTNTWFYCATLTGADLTNANVRGAFFSSVTGFTEAQLYSTAGYKAKNLAEIGLAGNNLSGWNFADQDLTNAYFDSAVLTGADLTNANVRGAWFAGATGFTAAQLYSTASYKAKDLTGIGLAGNDLTGWNFAGQDLTGADFSSATLTGADARGAANLNLAGAASTQNLIMPGGSINGLHLSGGRTLVVRNYTASSIPITVQSGMSMGTDGILQMVLDADAWGSTISFDASIPVALGGTLDVTFAAGVNVAGQVGRSFDLFDWSGVSPAGTFATVTLPAAEGLRWDITTLYTTGTIGIYYYGDVNHDNLVNAADIDAVYGNFDGGALYDLNGDGEVDQVDVDTLVRTILHTGYGDANLDRRVEFMDFQILVDHWQKPAGWATGDWTGDGTCEFVDFQKLVDNWNPSGFPGSPVPEPASAALFLLGAVGMLRRRRL